jgi:exoribonuclease R
MADGRRREGAADRMGLDLVEAAVLSGCIGAELDGVVTSVSKGQASVQVREPAVVASVRDDHLEPGDEVRLRVRSTDVAKRSVDFAVSRP